MEEIYNKAIALIRKSTTKKGILASPDEQDNYKRVWARDSIISGIAGILCNDKVIIEGLKNSLLTLAKWQLDKGTIPSNVGLEPNNPSVSYGSIVGRVDATSWFIIGVCLYLKNINDAKFKLKINSHIVKAIQILDCWEFNDKHLIYTPLSGNWADEYPLHGYLLYDNGLRLWGLELYSKVFKSDKYNFKIKRIRNTMTDNFWPQKGAKNSYQPTLFKKQLHNELPYFRAGFNPADYYNYFDAAGNGIALILQLADEKKQLQLETYIGNFTKQLIPAFWPVINENDYLWSQLKSNYTFEFKNKPHHFHNGGIWPVMMGILSIGLAINKRQQLVNKMLHSYIKIIKNLNEPFYEYIDSSDFKPQGGKNLCFSASGYLFMYQSIFHENIKKILF